MGAVHSRSAKMVVLAFILLLPASPAQQPAATLQDSHTSKSLDLLHTVRTPETAAISPDGNYVAWTVEGSSGWELHLTGIAPPGSVQDAAWDRILSPDTIGDVTNLRPGKCEADHPAWSPDGKQLAFLSDCMLAGSKFSKTKQKNIFLWTLATNQVTQLTDLKGQLSSLEWSPEGKSIAFLFVENDTRRARALDAMKPRKGVAGEGNVDVQQIAAVDASGQHFFAPFRLGFDLHACEFTWAPDSQHIVFVAGHRPGEDNGSVAKLYIDDFGGLATCDSQSACIYNGPPVPAPTVLLDPSTAPGPLHGLQIAVPRFSPDGKQIAFIGGLRSDQAANRRDIYIIPAPQPGTFVGLAHRQAQPKNITPNRPSSPAWIQWRNDHSLLVSEHVGGSSHVTAINTVTGKDDPAIDLTLPGTIFAGTDVMSISTSHTENVALIRQSFEGGPEVWAGPITDLKQLTHLNDDVRNGASPNANAGGRRRP